METLCQKACPVFRCSDVFFFPLCSFIKHYYGPGTVLGADIINHEWTFVPTARTLPPWSSAISQNVGLRYQIPTTWHPSQLIELLKYACIFVTIACYFQLKVTKEYSLWKKWKKNYRNKTEDKYKIPDYSWNAVIWWALLKLNSWKKDIALYIKKFF